MFTYFSTMSIYIKILAFLAAFSATTYLYSGIYTLSLDKKSRPHRIFFAVTLTLALWSFCIFWVYTASNIDTVKMWVKISFIGVILFYALNLHLVLEITGMVRTFSRYIYIIYLPSFYFAYVNIRSYILYKNFQFLNGKWIFYFGNEFHKTGLFLLYSGIYVGLTTSILLLYSKKASSIRKKRQAKTLSISFFCALTCAAIESLLLPVISSYKSTQAVSIFLLIWIFGVWFSIVKYRFLSISPAMVSKDIVDNISDEVILLGENLNIISVNKKVEDLTGKSSEELKHKKISEIIIEHRGLYREIKNIRKENKKEFFDRIHFKNKNGKLSLMNAKIKMIYDRFGDKIGVVIIGKDSKDLKNFISNYNITPREVEIVHQLIVGKSNKEIAHRLNLSIRTVKAHLTSIFGKVGVSNRFQLLNLLNEYTLSLSINSGKRLLIKTNNNFNSS